jgi:hypothetical protein
MSIERRKAKRFRVVQLDLYHRDTGTLIGEAINLSEGGVLALVTNEMEQHEIVPLRILFKRDDGEQINFNIDARVIWSLRDIHTNSYSTGMAFINHSKEQYMFIEKLIDLFGEK